MKHILSALTFWTVVTMGIVAMTTMVNAEETSTSLSGLPAVEPQDPDTYPYCSPQSDMCQFKGQELSRSDLLDIFMVWPARAEETQDYFCQFESCWDNNGYWIGLNPYFYYGRETLK